MADRRLPAPPPPAAARYTVAAMRVIAGTFRGRSIIAPPGLATRPILDRVKVALFDWLGARLAMPGRLPPLHVLDIFSGAGSLGIEAMSRGAASCTFVETDAAAVDCLRKNIAALRINHTRVITERAERMTARPPADDGAFGLIFLDPPYPLSQNTEPGAPICRVFERLGPAAPVLPDATLIWRHDVRFRPPAGLPGGWHIHEARSYGTMTLSLLRPCPPENASPPQTSTDDPQVPT